MQNRSARPERVLRFDMARQWRATPHSSCLIPNFCLDTPVLKSTVRSLNYWLLISSKPTTDALTLRCLSLAWIKLTCHMSASGTGRISRLRSWQATQCSHRWKVYRAFPVYFLSSRCQDLKNQGVLPATEFGLGIMREADVCGGYAMGPSGEWLEGCGGPGAPADMLGCCWSVLDGVSAGVAVALLESSSATGEQVSARTLCARPWRPLPLRLPSLLHSRLEPLRSSFSEELVMVAESRFKFKKKKRERERRDFQQVREVKWGEEAQDISE